MNMKYADIRQDITPHINPAGIVHMHIQPPDTQLIDIRNITRQRDRPRLHQQRIDTQRHIIPLQDDIIHTHGIAQQAIAHIADLKARLIGPAADHLLRLQLGLYLNRKMQADQRKQHHAAQRQIPPGLQRHRAYRMKKQAFVQHRASVFPG